MRRVIFTDGTTKELPNKLSFKQLLKEAGIEFGELVRNVDKKRCHMLVEENGHAMRLQPNIEATRLYNEMCGFETGHVIVGNVVVFPKGDRIL